MPDNMYYIFKDAKGKKHTVDKTAYDKDPHGFAKAFPGARMEVIDRRTGRSGDVAVKDAGRIGDFGAHLFTGRWKGNPQQHQQQPKTALGRAQQSVAQQKWGSPASGGQGASSGGSNDWLSMQNPNSELVGGLYEADDINRREERQMPIDYTKPGAMKAMIGRTRREQQTVGNRMEQAGRNAGETAKGEIRRRNAPAFDLGNSDVNNNIVKTRGQLEGDMEKSAASIANNDFADTFANMITSERQAAENRAMDAQKRAFINSMPGASNPMTTLLLRTAAYNAERDPVKLQQNLSKNLEKNMESMLSDPNVAQKIVRESERLGVSPEDYVKTALMPAIQDKLMAEYDKSELQQWMPRNAFVDIIDGIGDGLRGGLLLDSILTKSQRQYRERAAMATQNDENPYYQRDKYGVTEGVRSAVSLASDATGPGGGIFGGIAKGVGKTSAKVFGNEVKTIANYANMTKLQRMFKPTVLLRGAAEGAANFGIYEGLKGAQSYSSTTDDVKLGEMLENSAVSAAHGAVSGATLGVVGKMLGGLGYNVGIKGPKGIDPNFGKNMLKGLGMKGMQVVGEGAAFYTGGNINNAISGQETDWSAGNLLSNIMAAGIYKIVSTHTATGAANIFAPGKGQSYGDSVAVKFGTALYKAAMAPSTQSKAFAFTPEEKSQLFVAGDKAGMPGREGYLGRPDILTWAGRVMKDIPVGKEDKSGNVQTVREYYSSVMRDPNVSWDAKMKLNALLGIAPATRPTMDYRTYTVEDGKRYVNEYAKDGVLLSKRSYKNMEQREAIEYDMIMQNENQRMLDGISYILNKDCEQTDLQTEFLKQHGYDFNNTDSPINQAIMDSMFGKSKNKEGRTLHDEWIDFVGKNGRTTKLIKEIAEAHGLSVEEMFKIVNEEPIKRTEEEQRACVELRKTLDDMVYEDGMPHEDQAERDGKDVVEENGLGTENPNNEAAAKVLFNMVNAEKAFQYALKNDDNLQHGYEYYKKAGLSNPQIYLKLMEDGYGNEVTLAPFADYINAKAKAVGMYRGTKQKIAETVQKHVEQWSYKGELNGEKQEGGQMLFVKDNKGRLLIVGAGDVAFDNDGRAREGVGDMISVLDAEKGEMDFVSVKDVKLERTVASKEYAKEYQELLEVKNSTVYAQNEQQKQMENAAGGVAPEGGKPEKPITEQGNAETTVQTGEANKPVPTFADGSPVPMTKDSKGRETADYSMMTPEQGVEWIEKTFGEDAEAVADGKIERAKKDLSKAEKMDIDMTADDADVLEAKAKKKAAIEAAQKELELYTNIKKAMVEKKVKATMEKENTVGEVDSASRVSDAVREKFEKSKKIPGRRGSITLPDGTKITGQYFYGEVSGLTPSHDPFNDFKQNEGFPVNEDGSSSNSRSYKDKESRLFTEKIGRDFGGQALKNVPVVQDGILLSGNGTTMGKQLAERYGTDGKYYESLSENAEGFGWTPKQIEEAGFKGTVYFVPDKKMPLTSKTFDLFNKQETKSIGNTKQSVKNAKVLDTDEISAIVSEIEGSGSLDAFFNNPTAINSLLKRLIDKGVIGLNEVAGLREGENKLSASGKDFVRNLLLGSVFSEDTIRMMGADAGLKSKALNGIRAVLDNMKLGDYALRGEIDKAVQLVYEARQQGGDVDAYLRTPAMFGENAADRYDPVSQAIALALDGKAEDFRDLMMAYNRNAAHYADANQLDVFGDRPTKEEFINEFLKLRNWKNYETRRSENEGNGDVGGTQGSEPETPGGNEPTEGNGEGLGSRGNTEQGENIDAVPAKKDSGTHDENTEGESGNVGLGSIGESTRANEEQREVDKAEEEKSDKPHEASLGLTKPVEPTKPKGEGETKPKGEEPSKTNPLAWLAHTAEMFKDEQVQKARKELSAAKESGDASDIKRATEKMKQAMETKLRGNGIGLVERRRIIGRELGKILGEEAGKTEAEKINKPWEQMDLEEREAVSSKNPLTETEINELTSEENKELIPAALAYLRGDKGNIINAISYFKIWNDVRSRHENVPDNSGTKDGTQLDAPNTGGSQELGLGRGREGGGPDRPVDRTDSERTTPGKRESGTGGENDTPVSTGKPRVDKGEGNTPGMDAVSAGSTDTRGGGGAGNEGNVPKRGGQGGGNGPLDPNAGRKPATKQGTHFPDSTSERLKQERAEYEQKKKDFWERWKKAGQGYVKIALTPFKKLNLSPEQIEMLPELFKMHLNGAVLKIKEGIYKFNEWKAAMRAEEGEELKMIGLSDDDVDRFIEDYWNTPYQMDGETHTIGEWAGIHGNEELRNKLSEPLNDKYQRQMEAEPIKVKIGDKKNIEETLPYLLPQQQEDVLKAETQFFGKEHADREHAYGKGYMFTNGTGTGKTFTGLGIAKRLVKQGKGRILIVTPSQKKVSDWIKDGRNLNMEIRDLDSIAKERGTTATTESGEGVVITTFANFGVNKKLLETKWDAVIYDESHRIMENKNGAETARSMQHYMMTNRSENHCFLRLQETNADYQKMKSLSEQFNAERDKEVKRIQDEYKASHPSATARDISYATSKALPKEIINFTPGDYASFPKLGEIHSEFKKAFSHYINEVMPKLEAQAKSEWKDTKTIFLSATPFNTRENLDYAEGYIFKYPEEEKGGRMSGRTQFYLDHFGAAYKFRYGRLEQSTSNPEAVAKQEIAFSDYLQDTLGTMSGRIIDSPYDYSRDFPTVSPDHAEQFNQAVQDAVRGHGVLADAYRKTIGDYTYGSALFETMKVANIIERIKAHLDAGRKVVVFHRRVETKEPIKPPFALMLDRANYSISLMKPGEAKNEAIQAVRAFSRKYADLLKWEQTLDYSMPREQIAKVFGKDNVLFFSGKESSKVKDKAVDTFNDDNSGKNIIVIQEASGKEGISLHDKTGEHQRVCITLALPQSPITALQIEGRTYRIGNKSNAIFEYPILGLNSEMMLFGEKFNNQVSTTENLALGSKARSLRDSFAKGILEHSGVVPIEQQGVGGKEFDAPKEQNADPYDDAVLDYYSNQKLNSRNREGVDYFPTPEPLGYKMVEWANMGEGDTAMEPSAGHGAIARYVPKGNQMTAIEPSQSLFTKLQLKAGGLGRKFVNTIFENYDLKNKHDVVVMNPPFGTAGATAIAHLGKAFKHLEEGGRVVALIPRGSTDKKFDKWIEGEKTAVLRAEVELPDIVFEQAGTKVVCRVVVVDKISNEAMRAKAGRAEKWNLGEHYDKIEDFFEDLRDVKMPDRIIDTNAIMMKKSKQTVKDLKELKGVKVDFSKGGISVNVRGDWNDYSVPFWGDGYTAEQKKKYTASTYETLEQQERQTGNETSQAVIAELKKLTCKLAGMTEEEMQRYLKKKYEGKGVMYRVEHAAEVYNKAKGGSKGQRYGRVAPEDVDKKTSERIEKRFKEKTAGIIELAKTAEDMEELESDLADTVRAYSLMRKIDIEYEVNSDRREIDSNLAAKVSPRDRNVLKRAGRILAAERELEYRRVRANNFREAYGLQERRDASPYQIKDILDKAIERTTGMSKDAKVSLQNLARRVVDLSAKLGVDIQIGHTPDEEGLGGYSDYDRNGNRIIEYYLDTLTRTSSPQWNVPALLLHEMIHQATVGSIRLVERGKADGFLTPKQISAVNTIFDIYNKVAKNPDRLKASSYGLTDAYEFTAQMADPMQRKALDKYESIVYAWRKHGTADERTLWQRFKEALSILFGTSERSKMDKAINAILDDFNKSIDDAANERRLRLRRKGVVTPEKTSNAMSERIIKTVEKVAKRTGGKVKMVNSVEEIENPKVRKDIENGKQVTGWYDEKTGEVHLYMPNIHDTYTAEKTVWHETVGHKGMRGLLGDKFDSYMRDLWMDLDNPINAELRAYVKEKMNMNHLGFYDAIEEFIAKSAEDGKGEPGFWNYIKNKVTDALHEIGYRVSPNVKDVKYMLWLAKNVQKHGDSPLWKLRAEAVRWKIEHEKTEYTKIEGGELYDNDGKSHDFENMSREEWLEATDGEIHYRTAPSAATALDRYHHALDRHSYMATEAFMDNMLSLKKLMEAIDPSIKKIEDVASSMNPYLMQNITEGKMSDKSKLFEIRYMDPLSKAMSSVLDSFDGKKVEDRIRSFNLYMIRKHGLERNRVLFVRDWIKSEKGKVKSEESNSIDALESAWKGEKYDLRKKLDSGQIDLKEYYRQMDEWIVQNLDKDFKAEEHDYSGMHGLQGIADKKAPYDDAGAIDEVMSQEASMESMKKGSVADFWKKVKAATDYSVNSDYESGLISQITHDGVLGMFDWYVPLRKFDEATAEDVYGYVTEMGDPSNYIGTTLMHAKGRKSLSNVEILAQIGLMGNRAIRNGGQNTIKQAFARFVRNSGEQNLVKETKVWVEKNGTDRNGNDIWEEAYPHIPEGAEADEVAEIVDAFETDMRAKQAKGEAKSLSNSTDIGFKFQRAKDKSQHFVDVKIAGRTHRFVVLGNPRAAQALNGMLENGKASQKWLQTVTRWMAMASTSWSPEFVMRNIVRDAEFASSHVRAKEGGRYAKKWARYYGELNPLNVFYNEGAGRLKSMKMKDFKNGVGFGLYARYREGTLGNSKMERYFKEFMENGGETGFVQLFSMLDMEKSYKSIVEKESAKGAKKVMVNAVEVLKNLGKNVESLNEVAENMARFATYCTSRDLGRSAARSAYDAKEVSTNFNRHGSGDEIKSFKNGEMSGWQKTRRNTYGFVAGYLRNYSMFFNAGIQSTNLLLKNIKRAPVGTAVAMTSAPFALALIMAAVNNAIIQNEDDKDRGNVKDPYGELPDYIRRNNLCIYVGKNRFVTVPLAIELRAFYSLGDLAAGQTFAKNVKSQRNWAMDAVGCMSQLFPVTDFLNNPNFEKSVTNGLSMFGEAVAPAAFVPFIEWLLNNDWKGAPIRRTGDKTELNPAWQNAYNNVPARLVDLNKWVNAKTNNIAPGNPEMKGNDALDWITDPSMLNHFYSSWSGGMGTFVQRTAGLGAKATTGKADEIEVGDVPFLRSLFYTPREQSSMARTKAKWYNYKEEMEQTIANNDKLKSKNVPTMKRIENAAALEKFEGSPEQRKVNIIKNAEKRMRHWNTMRKKWADDKKQVDFANHNIEMIMQEAVEELDKIE